MLSSPPLLNPHRNSISPQPSVPHSVPQLKRRLGAAAAPLRLPRCCPITAVKANSTMNSRFGEGHRTLLEFAGKGEADVGDDLTVLLGHLQYACKRIAAVVASPFNSELGKQAGGGGTTSSVTGRDAPKPLDIVSNEIILSSLRSSGKVAVMASEEDDSPVWINDNGPFVVVTDPLDGSRNIDASIPTGTIFGIYNRLVELDHLPVEEKAQLNSLQSGTHLVAAGYVLYSSATILCVSFGSGTHAFTLDRVTGEFVLTHSSIKIPSRDKGICQPSSLNLLLVPDPNLVWRRELWCTYPHLSSLTRRLVANPHLVWRTFMHLPSSLLPDTTSVREEEKRKAEGQISNFTRDLTTQADANGKNHRREVR